MTFITVILFWILLILRINYIRNMYYIGLHILVIEVFSLMVPDSLAPLVSKTLECHKGTLLVFSWRWFKEIRHNLHNLCKGLCGGCTIMWLLSDRRSWDPSGIAHSRILNIWRGMFTDRKHYPCTRMGLLLFD